MRYFLVDRVTELVPGQRIRGIKAVTLTDEVLNDHFPDHPILPGALLVEGAAQLAGFLLEVSAMDPQVEPPLRAILTGIERLHFHDMLTPGDVVEITVHLESLLAGAGRVGVEATCGERLVARGRLTLLLRAIDGDGVHAQRRALYKLWTRGLPSCPPWR